MINKTVYILGNPNETEEGMLADISGWGMEDINEAKRVANFGAVIAPSNKVFEVITYVKEVTK